MRTQKNSRQPRKRHLQVPAVEVPSRTERYNGKGNLWMVRRPLTDEECARGRIIVPDENGGKLEVVPDNVLDQRRDYLVIPGREKGMKPRLIDATQDLPGHDRSMKPSRRLMENHRELYEAAVKIMDNYIDAQRLSVYVDSRKLRALSSNEFVGHLGNGAKKPEESGPSLRHDLTMVKKEGVYESELVDPAYRINSMRRRSFRAFKDRTLAIFDFKIKKMLEFDLDPDSDRCVWDVANGRDGIMKAYVPIPQGNHEESDPLGVLVMSGDLGLKDSRKSGLAKLYFSAGACMNAAVCIGEMLMHRRDWLTKLTRRGDFETDFRGMVGRLISGNGNGKADTKGNFLLLIDLDNFKRVNTDYGHYTGDLLLSCVADILKEREWKASLVSRWGGEEFVMLISGLSEEEVKKRARELHAKLGMLGIAGPANIVTRDETDKLGMPPDTVDWRTCSIGVLDVAGMLGRMGTEDVEKACGGIFRKCNELLLKAKDSGRNRVYYSDGSDVVEDVNGKHD